MVTQNTMHKQERNKGAIDEILTELLVFDEQPKQAELPSNPSGTSISSNISKTKAVTEQ